MGEVSSNNLVISNDGNESATGLSKSKKFNCSTVSFSVEPKGQFYAWYFTVQLIKNHGTSSASFTRNLYSKTNAVTFTVDIIKVPFIAKYSFLIIKHVFVANVTRKFTGLCHVVMK